MDFLKAEMKRKKKQLDDSNLLIPNKKFFRRGDLIAQEEEQYWHKYHEKHGKPVAENDTADRATDSPSTSEEHIDYKKLSRHEVIKRLRQRNEPIMLFGEEQVDAAKRLRTLEIETPELNQGWRNDLKDAQDKVEEEYMNEILIEKSEESDTKKFDVQIQELDQFSYDELVKESHGLEKAEAAEQNEAVYKFLKYLLFRWGQQLNNRNEEEKRTPQGRKVSSIFVQTQDYLKPLMNSLAKKKCQTDILDHMVSIVFYLLTRNYIQANNAYMEMAIGNAPWPVGVTASGIHKRPGNEKLYVKNIAHVLNDETQRKYIQAVKRLITRCQHLFPTDPSKSIDFGGYSALE